MDQLSSVLHGAFMVERERLEIRHRELAEAALQRAHAELERRVGDRTAELARANDILTETLVSRVREILDRAR